MTMPASQDFPSSGLSLLELKFAEEEGESKPLSYAAAADDCVIVVLKIEGV